MAGAQGLQGGGVGRPVAEGAVGRYGDDGAQGAGGGVVVDNQDVVGVGVGVVVQEAGGGLEELVGVGEVAVVDGVGGVVAAVDDDLDGADGGAPGRVLDGVGEAVEYRLAGSQAIKLGRPGRVVAITPIRVHQHPGPQLTRLVKCRHRQRVAGVRVVIIGQQSPRATGEDCVFHCRGRILLGHRQIIPAGDRDLHRACGRATVAILNDIGEGVQHLFANGQRLQRCRRLRIIGIAAVGIYRNHSAERASFIKSGD